jgi:hypothetical protein
MHGEARQIIDIARYAGIISAVDFEALERKSSFGFFQGMRTIHKKAAGYA